MRIRPLPQSFLFRIPALPHPLSDPPSSHLGSSGPSVAASTFRLATPSPIHYHPPVRRTLLALIPTSLCLAGCIVAPEGFDSPEPGKRVRAIARAARDKDEKSIPRLIRFLDSDDPAVRMASIRTLELITGSARDYDYAAPEWQRDDMIKVWLEWYNQNYPQGPPVYRFRPRSSDPKAPETTEPKPGNADTVSTSGS